MALANLAIVLRPFGCITPNVLNYLAFQSSDFETYLMMVIPETRRAHLISMFLLLLDTFMLANTKHFGRTCLRLRFYYQQNSMKIRE